MSRLRAAFAGLTAVVALAGCTVTATDLPLPGGEVEGATYRLTAEFADALNLPDKAHVKLGGVRIGTVTAITAHNYRARVSMLLQRSVQLPRGTRAELRQATPLGDVFVALQPPERKSDRPLLADGDTIGIDHTASAATVEDSLSAMATLINGGGLGQLDPIVDEVNTALDGRGPKIRSLLRELDRTLQTLDERTGDIDRILSAADKLTRLATKRRPTLDAALSDFGPAIDVVEGNTDKVRQLLVKAAGTAEVAERLLAEGGDDVEAVLRDGGKLLDGLAVLEDDLGPSLRSLVTLGKFVRGATKGTAGAGETSFEADDLLQLLRVNGVPSPKDFSRVGESSLGTLADFLDRLAGGDR